MTIPTIGNHIDVTADRLWVIARQLRASYREAVGFGLHLADGSSFTAVRIIDEKGNELWAKYQD